MENSINEVMLMVHDVADSGESEPIQAKVLTWSSAAYFSLLGEAGQA